MKKLRFGIIGCGAMMKSHVMGMAEVEGAEMAAFCDLIEENARDFANSANPDAYVTTDYKTMLDYVDAVLVATNHQTHYDIGMFFAMNKKHVLMEKPLCNTIEECDMLTQTAKDNGIVLMCAYPVPFWPGMVKLKELVDTGDYGKIMQMSIWTEQLTSTNPGYPGSNGNLGGGQFFSHGCHYVDVMLRFLGEPIEGAHFGTRVGTPWMLGEGTSAAIFKFENGALGYHGATWGARGTKMGWDCQIMLEKGVLEYDRFAGQIKYYHDNNEHVVNAEEEKKYVVLWEEDSSISKRTQHEMRHFMHCIETGERPITDGERATKSLKIIKKMYDAEKMGTVANLRGLGLDEAGRVLG